MEQVEGISQKSLTKTLRGLEREGLVTRKVFAEVPPRVEYAITPLGLEMLQHVEPLWLWVAASVKKFQQSRVEFDQR
jgi:DNA-binding HxlR family transcriptional regulator